MISHLCSVVFRQKEEIVKGGEADQSKKKLKNSKGVGTPDGKAHGQVCSYLFQVYFSERLMII